MTTLIETTENGRRVSPKVATHIKNFLIDIDGTICEDIPNEEPWRMADAAVFSEALVILNKWYDEGHIITFFSSRTEEHREVTMQWLEKHGFRYHGLLLGKPRGGNYHWIDDREVRATQYAGHFTELVEKRATVQVFEE